MLVLTAAEVRAALPMDQAVQAMKEAFAALSGGRADVPLRSRLSVPPHEGLALLMPAFVELAAGEALGVKVVSLFPGNPERGLQFIQAVVLVMEPDTGRPVGLLEGSSLTALRTGAAGGASVEVLSKPDSRILAVIGAGTQGHAQLEAACTVRSVETVWIHDASLQKARAMSQQVAGVGTVPRDVRVAESANEALAEADVVITATTSSSPVFSDSALKRGAHISAIGSYTPEMQEIPSETAARARVFVDSRPAALAETGDLIKPIRAGLFGEEHIAAELGEVILGKVSGRQTPDQITLFKSVGVAVQDAVAATVALENARKAGLGQEVQL